jgi:subtilisin-like proprotein convertase family protein
VADEMIVEHVELSIVATIEKRGDLEISLKSPHGTISILAESHRDTNANYDWTFGSLRHW